MQEARINATRHFASHSSSANSLYSSNNKLMLKRKVKPGLHLLLLTSQQIGRIIRALENCFVVSLQALYILSSNHNVADFTFLVGYNSTWQRMMVSPTPPFKFASLVLKLEIIESFWWCICVLINLGKQNNLISVGFQQKTQRMVATKY